MKNRSAAISVRISPAARKELEDIAKVESRTISQVVAMMIEESLDRRRKEK
jgi:predicted transcriptional regulator